LRIGLALASGVSKLTDGSDHTRNPCSGADEIGRLAGWRGPFLFIAQPRSQKLAKSERERRLANCLRRREPPQSQSENLAARSGPSKRQPSAG
jgi:hypothetical protein